MKKLFWYSVLIFLLSWLIGYAFFVNYVLHQKPEAQNEKTDAIIVLTGGNFRIKTGLSLFNQGLSPQLFISGVHKSVTEDDIIAMKQDGETVPDCCITLGHSAETTLENAAETREWIISNKIKSIRLVTSPYHLLRSTLEFKNALKDDDIKIILHPVEEIDYGPTDKKFWILTFAEYNKVLFRSLILIPDNIKKH